MSRHKQLYTHARALDVLIATLFKRLYNFQSFILAAFCVGGGVETISRFCNALWTWKKSVLRSQALRRLDAIRNFNKTILDLLLAQHTEKNVWMNGYFRNGSKVIKTVVVSFWVRTKKRRKKSAKSKSWGKSGEPKETYLGLWLHVCKENIFWMVWHLTFSDANLTIQTHGCDNLANLRVKLCQIETLNLISNKFSNYFSNSRFDPSAVDSLNSVKLGDNPHIS